MERLKPADAMIVGMFPKFKDEIADNVARVSRLAAEIAT